MIENLPGAGGITGTTQIVRAHEPARRLFAAALGAIRDVDAAGAQWIAGSYPARRLGVQSPISLTRRASAFRAVCGVAAFVDSTVHSCIPSRANLRGCKGGERVLGRLGDRCGVQQPCGQPQRVQEHSVRFAGRHHAITIIGRHAFVLVAHPSVPPECAGADRLRQVQTGVLNYGSSGNGTILHLGAAMFVDRRKLAIQHIPYKGMGPLMNDVLGGQVQLAVVAVALRRHIKSGALRAMGVTTSTRAWPRCPACRPLPSKACPYSWTAGLPPWPLPACPRPSWPAVQRLQGSDGDARSARCARRPGLRNQAHPPDAPPPSSAAKPRAWQVVNANVKLD